MAAERKAGRYDRIEEATHPGPALPTAPRRMRGKVEIVTAAVPDPNPLMGEKLRRQRVSVNRLTDPVECERSFGRISDRAYLAGKAYLRVVDPGGGGKSSLEPGDGGGGSHELAIGYAIDRARAVVEMQDDVQRAIGESAARILRGVIADGHSFAEMAAVVRAPGRSKRARRAQVAREFREALEGLACHWDRYGWPESAS